MELVTKTFRATNMLEALQQVQRELGSDAIVVSMRKVPGGPAWQVWRTPMIEIIAMRNSAYAQQQGATPAMKAAPKKQPPAQPQGTATPPAAEKKPLKSTSENTDSPPNPPPAGAHYSPTAVTMPISAHHAPTTLIQSSVVAQTPAANTEIPHPEKALKKEKLPTIDEVKDVEVDNLAVSATVQALIQPKVKQNQQWRPFIPPHITLKREERPSDSRPIEIPDWRPRTLPPPATRYSPAPDQQTQEAGQPVAAAAESGKTEPHNLLNTPSLPRLLKQTRDQLMAQGLEENMIVQLLSTCLDILPPKALEDESRVRHLVQRQLEAEIRILKSEEGFTPRILFLIGSSGVGKTSTCAKLAAYASQVYNKKVAWICADTIQTSAISQARTFTDLLNMPLYLAYTPEELEETIHQENSADLILVDTADCNPRREESVVELGNFITQIPTRSTFLVVSATTKQADLNQSLAAYKPFRIKGLVVTKMDETLTYGNVYNIAWRSQVPLVYFTDGQNIMNNLHPGSTQMLVNSLLGEGFAK